MGGVRKAAFARQVPHLRIAVRVEQVVSVLDHLIPRDSQAFGRVDRRAQLLGVDVARAKTADAAVGTERFQRLKGDLDRDRLVARRSAGMVVGGMGVQQLDGLHAEALTHEAPTRVQFERRRSAAGGGDARPRPLM